MNNQSKINKDALRKSKAIFMPVDSTKVNFYGEPNSISYGYNDYGQVDKIRVYDGKGNTYEELIEYEYKIIVKPYQDKLNKYNNKGVD